MGENISVRLGSAKGLKKGHELYCLVKLGKDQRRSRDTKKTRDGIFSWDELFQMKADDKVLTVDVMKHSIVKKHCLGQVFVDLHDVKSDGPTWYPLIKKKDSTPVPRGEIQLTIEGLKKAKGKALDISAIEKEMGIDLSIPTSPHSSFDPSNHLNELNVGSARIKAGELDTGTFRLQNTSLETGVVHFSFKNDSAIFDLYLPRKFTWTRTYSQHAYCRASLSGIASLRLRPLHCVAVSFTDDSTASDVSIITIEGKAISEENQNVASLKAVAKVSKSSVQKIIDDDDVYESAPEYNEGELLDAAQKGLPDKVKACLDRWDDVNVKNENDETPLHKAVTNGNQEIIKLLVERGAEPRNVDKFGSSPVDIAEKYFKTELIPLLRTYQ